jgi:hypothetical protein
MPVKEELRYNMILSKRKCARNVDRPTAGGTSATMASKSQTIPLQMKHVREWISPHSRSEASDLFPQESSQRKSSMRTQTEQADEGDQQQDDVGREEGNGIKFDALDV